MVQVWVWRLLSAAISDTQDKLTNKDLTDDIEIRNNGKMTYRQSAKWEDCWARKRGNFSAVEDVIGKLSESCRVLSGGLYLKVSIPHFEYTS